MDARRLDWGSRLCCDCGSVSEGFEHKLRCRNSPSLAAVVALARVASSVFGIETIVTILVAIDILVTAICDIIGAGVPTSPTTCRSVVVATVPAATTAGCRFVSR